MAPRLKLLTCRFLAHIRGRKNQQTIMASPSTEPHKPTQLYKDTWEVTPRFRV